MKTTNEKLFEILDKMFPGGYFIKDNGIREKGEWCFVGGYGELDEYIFYPDFKIGHAFWLAEKVGLFKDKRRSLTLINEEWSIREYTTGYGIECGKTPQEAIVNAILEIYGEKENN